MSTAPLPQSPQTEQARGVIAAFSGAVAVLASLTDAGSTVDLVFCALPVAAFVAWAFLPRVPLPALVVTVLVPVVAAQHSGQLEPLLFEVSLLGYVIGRFAPTTAAALGLGVLATLSPVVGNAIQDPGEIAVGIWIMGIALPWFFGRQAAREGRLAAELDATRRELAQQALQTERRQIARDVHDFVGHGLAAVMLQVTSARHVLHRDPAAAEEALLSAEETGRRSMRELRRTVALLRSDDESGIAPPLPSAEEIPALVDHARAGGLDVELRTRGDLTGIGPGVGVALYRISQEALANAARHAPHARTLLRVELIDGRACLDAETTGPTMPASASEPDRPRYGLIGMRERATALGGEFSAGPTADGWRVSCRLPLAASDAMRGEAHVR